MRQNPEASLQRAVVQYLSLLENQRRLYFFAVPNQGGAGLKKRGAVLKGLGQRAGVSDLVIMYGSTGGVPKTAFVELKAPSGSMSLAQHLFADQCERFGFEYHVVRGLDEMVNLIETWGLVRVRAEKKTRSP